jgi:hypothetical protein
LGVSQPEATSRPTVERALCERRGKRQIESRVEVGNRAGALLFGEEFAAEHLEFGAPRYALERQTIELGQCSWAIA